jgi:hypothetical protein
MMEAEKISPRGWFKELALHEAERRYEMLPAFTGRREQAIARLQTCIVDYRPVTILRGSIKGPNQSNPRVFSSVEARFVPCSFNELRSINKLTR